MTLVSIIVNCWNGEETLGRALESIKRQTHQSFEVIFVDNCSTDKSVQIANQYDSRFRVFITPRHCSLGKARQFGLSKCQGEWIAFLDCDDWWIEDRLRWHLDAIARSRDEVCLSYAGVSMINTSGKVVGVGMPQATTNNALELNAMRPEIPISTLLLNRSFLLRYGIKFDISQQISEELDISLRLMCVGKALPVSRILAYYSCSGNSLTHRQAVYASHDLRKTIMSIKEMSKVGWIRDDMHKVKNALRCLEYKACYYDVKVGGELIPSKRLFRSRRALLLSGSFIYTLVGILSYFKPVWIVLNHRKTKYVYAMISPVISGNIRYVKSMILLILRRMTQRQDKIRE